MLLLTGALIGLLCWPLAEWLSQTRTSPAEGRAAADERAAAELAAEQGHATAETKPEPGDASKNPGAASKAGDRTEGDPKAGDPKAGTKGVNPKRTDRAEPSAPARRTEAVGPTSRPDAPVCSGSDISVTVRPERDGSPAGRPLAFQLLVRNGGATGCRIPADPKQVRVAVLGGDQRVLDTDRCAAAIDVRPPVLKPGRSAEVTVRWNGRVTGAGCSADAPFAEPGTYSVQSEVLGAFSAPAPFELR